MGKRHKQMFLRRGDKYVVTREETLHTTRNRGKARAVRFHFIPTVIDKN